MRSDDHSGAEVPGSKSLPDRRRVPLRLSSVPETFGLDRPSDSDEAPRRRGAIQPLPKGAGLRNATYRPSLSSAARKEERHASPEAVLDCVTGLCWLCSPSLAGATGHVPLSDSQIKANVAHKLSEFEGSSSR
jgi:hypothetical protein